VSFRFSLGRYKDAGPDYILYALRYTICALSLNLRIDSSLGSQARSEVFVGI